MKIVEFMYIIDHRSYMIDLLWHSQEGVGGTSTIL